ncbi:hypothetical protein ACHAWF_003915, partial [Thalassiosira exigua]
WKQFQAELNDFGVLRWTVNKPSKQCVFLDLSIKIDGSRIVTRTYQKPTKLALYLPGPSAHPAGMIKGTIFGLLRRYHEQNTLYSDYLHFAARLFRNLLARAWRAEDIRPIFIEAHRKIKHESLQPQPPPPAAAPPPEEDEKRLFLHFQYHPHDVPRRTIRRLYDQHCGEELRNALSVQPPTIAYSRPKNIKDYVAQARLHEAPGRPASYYLGEHDQGLAP